MNFILKTNAFRKTYKGQLWSRSLLFLAEDHMPSLRKTKTSDNILTALVFFAPFVISTSAFYWLLSNKIENGEGKRDDTFFPPRF